MTVKPGVLGNIDRKAMWSLSLQISWHGALPRAIWQKSQLLLIDGLVIELDFKILDQIQDNFSGLGLFALFAG